MSDEPKERKPREPKGPTADQSMLGMNWEAIHDKVELWGTAAICVQYMARGWSGEKLAKAITDAENAARDVIARRKGKK